MSLPTHRSPTFEEIATPEITSMCPRGVHRVAHVALGHVEKQSPALACKEPLLPSKRREITREKKRTGRRGCGAGTAGARRHHGVRREEGGCWGGMGVVPAGEGHGGGQIRAVWTRVVRHRWAARLMLGAGSPGPPSLRRGTRQHPPC